MKYLPQLMSYFLQWKTSPSKVLFNRKIYQQEYIVNHHILFVHSYNSITTIKNLTRVIRAVLGGRGYTKKHQLCKFFTPPSMYLKIYKNKTSNWEINLNLRNLTGLKIEIGVLGVFLKDINDMNLRWTQIFWKMVGLF